MKLKQLHKNFEVYSRALIESRDVDPVYPLVERIIEHYGFEPEWFIFCYQGFYNLESGIEMCKVMPTRNDWKPKKFKKMRKKGILTKFGMERRGTQRRVENQINMFSAVVSWLCEWDGIGRTIGIEIENKEFRESIELMPNFGSWSAYKISELFEKSLGYDMLELTDLGLEDKNFSRNDGPLGGLRWLFDKGRGDEDSCFNFSENKKTWLKIFNEFGDELSKAWKVDVGEVETCLCKYHKLHTGKYWIGHDIAEFIHLKDYFGNELFEKLMNGLFNSELYDYNEFPKDKKKIYKETGEILNVDFISKLEKINTRKIMKKVLKNNGIKI